MECQIIGEINDLFKIIYDFQDSLSRVIILIWVHLCKLRRADKLFIDFGAVFHSTGTQTDININILADGLLGQPEIMTQYLWLGHFWQCRTFLSFQMIWDKI